MYEPHLEGARGFRIFKHYNGEYRIGVHLNYAETEDRPVTYVQWSDTDTDIVEIEYTKTNRSIMQNNIWLNGEHVWELGDNTIDPYFVLVK